MYYKQKKVFQTGIFLKQYETPLLFRETLLLKHFFICNILYISKLVILVFQFR